MGSVVYKVKQIFQKKFKSICIYYQTFFSEYSNTFKNKYLYNQLYLNTFRKYQDFQGRHRNVYRVDFKRLRSYKCNAQAILHICIGHSDSDSDTFSRYVTIHVDMRSSFSPRKYCISYETSTIVTGPINAHCRRTRRITIPATIEFIILPPRHIQYSYNILLLPILCIMSSE